MTGRLASERCRRLFFAGLGVVFVMAFGSLLAQVDGLIGARGILPAAEWLDAWRDHVKGGPLEHDFARGLPTLCWFSASDATLHGLCVAGIAGGALLVLGVVPLFATFACWLLYLSLVNVGEIFLGYQWDALLLEVALLAVFFAPAGVRPWSGTPAPPSRAALWALRLLLFRFMFSSGAVKFLGGDETWWDHTALTFHYFTQPLPTVPGWFAHQLPASFHRLACVGMFAVELGASWLVFFGAIGRRLFALATIGLMVAIGTTGNYGFFEPLTIVLCLPVIGDDPKWPSTGESVRALREAFGGFAGSVRAFARAFATLAAALLAALGLVLFADRLSSSPIGPDWLRATQERVRDSIARSALFRGAIERLEPWQSLNHYGLFAVMTTTRPSIEIQGSDDLANWKSYDFRWKEGALDQPPRFCEPHMPRLDWQMWFAALRRLPEPWFRRFVNRLLEGEPSVVALTASGPAPGGPFGARPPRFIRAIRFDYEFTTTAERAATGAWWKRRETGIYLPPTSLR